MKSVIYAVLLLALGGCGNSSGIGSGDGGEGVAAVRPSRVTESDLRAAATEPRLVRFYEAREWRPAWNAAASEKLVAAIGGAAQHALDPDAFLAEARRAEAPAAREVALSLAALSYADALARGRVDPKRLRADYDVPRPNPELEAGLNQAIEQDELGNWLAGLAPQDEEYRQLASAYAEASRQSGADRRAPIADGATLRPGRADPRLPAIAAALGSGKDYQKSLGQSWTGNAGSARVYRDDEYGAGPSTRSGRRARAPRSRRSPPGTPRGIGWWT